MAEDATVRSLLQRDLRLLDATWRIDLFRFNLKFIDGNLQLEKELGA